MDNKYLHELEIIIKKKKNSNPLAQANLLHHFYRQNYELPSDFFPY